MNLRADPDNSLQDIINIINILKFIIHAINRRGIDINKPRPGHPKKLSERDVCQIIRYIRINKSTRRIILTCIKKLFHFHIHENTIRHALQKAGYYHRIARCRSYLNKCDRKRRLKFAREYKNWTIEDWARMLFSDEMAIKLFIE